MVFCMTQFWAKCLSDVQKALDRYLIPDARQMVHELTEATGPGFLKLNDAVSFPDTLPSLQLRG